eukprot:8436582-Pyramimonas_sp.AAC.1
MCACPDCTQGIALAKAGKYADALGRYAQALELDPRHRDAYVARGAAFANQVRVRLDLVSLGLSGVGTSIIRSLHFTGPPAPITARMHALNTPETLPLFSPW